MSKHQVVDISSFKYEHIPYNGFIEFLGKRGSGKTSWVRYMLTQLIDRQEGTFIVMAGSERVKDLWADMVPRLFVVDPSLEYLEKLKQHQTQMVKHYKHSDFPRVHHITLILDDCASIKTFMRSPILAWLASNGRHIELRICILVQYLNQCPCEIRDQFDIIFCLATSNRKNIAKLHEEYVGVGEFRTFRSVLNTMTEDRGCLVIDNRINSSSISGCCFYSKIENFPIVPIHIGDEQQWSYSEKHYIENIQTYVPHQLQQDVVEESDEEEDLEEIKKVMDTTRMYSDRLGKIIIRKTGQA